MTSATIWQIIVAHPYQKGFFFKSQIFKQKFTIETPLVIFENLTWPSQKFKELPRVFSNKFLWQISLRLFLILFSSFFALPWYFKPNEYNDSGNNVVPLKSIPFMHLIFFCLRKFFCYVHDDFMNMNFNANCFISFRVENSKENKDMLKKNWQKMLDFLHEINSQLISQFGLNYLKKFFVFGVFLFQSFV